MRHVRHLGASLFTLLATAGCVPELTSPDLRLTDWACPENDWTCEIPGRSVAEAPEYGFFPGQVLPPGRMVDQHGKEVDPWQFYGHVVVLDVSTMWCAPCRELACYTEDTWQSYKDQGMIYLTVIPQDAHGDIPDEADLQTWAEQFDVTAPILSDPETTWSRDASPLGQYPVVLVTDKTLTVSRRVEVTGDISAVDHTVRAEVESLLGIEPLAQDPISVCTD
jgi:thiol-disulfide isomerase/thioredoxin